MEATELEGCAVVSVASGARLGRVEAVLLDPASLALAALRVAADDQRAVIPFAQVRSLGRDAVMVPAEGVAQWAATPGAAEGLVSLDDLKGYKALDEAGTFLGTPRGVELEPADGRLVGLEVHKGGVLGLGGETTRIPGDALVSVGADVIVVRAAASAP